MKRISTLAALALIVSGQAQKVITVRSQHTKTLINTLRDKEFIVRGETRLLLKNNGETYEYLTQQEQVFRHYENDRLLQVLPYARFDRPKYYTYGVYKENRYLASAKLGGKEIGPFKDLRLFTTGSGSSEILHGYYYNDNDQHFLRDQVTGNTYGPYEAIRSPQISREHLLFACKKGTAWYVIDRKGAYGPYDSVVPFFASTHTEGLTYAYRENGLWNIRARNAVDRTFVKAPLLRFAADGSWEVCGIEARSNGKQCLFLQNGDVHEFHGEVQTLLYPGLPVLTAHAAAGTVYPGFQPQFEYGKAYTIRRGEEVLGEFYIERLYGKLHIPTGNYYPLIFYKKHPEGLNASRREFYLLHGQKGFTAPIPLDARFKLSVGEDTYAYYTGNERQLFLNGQQQPYTNVCLVDCYDAPKAWYMAIQEGDYVTLYKNGTPDASAATAARYTDYRFNTRNQPFVIVRRDDKSYAKTPHSSTLYGPVSPRSVIAFSKNNAHFAEGDEREALIRIDGKVISTGYGLVYNAAKNAYHWVSQEGQRLYLHTYELD